MSAENSDDWPNNDNNTNESCKLPLETNIALTLNLNLNPNPNSSQQQPTNHQNNNQPQHSHKQLSKPMDSQQMHVCRLCDKLLSSSSSLDRHMLTHSGERPFVCKRCHMTFTTNGNMHRHMRTHLHKDSLARQQQEQQLKSLAAGQISHSSASSPQPPPVTSQHQNLDTHSFNPLGPSNAVHRSSALDASLTSSPAARPFGHRNSIASCSSEQQQQQQQQQHQARQSPLPQHNHHHHHHRDPFSASLSDQHQQLLAAFNKQQQQQPVRTRRAHHQQQEQFFQNAAAASTATTTPATTASNLLALANQVASPSSTTLFGGNLVDLAQHSGGQISPASLNSTQGGAMASDSRTAKFLRHHNQQLDPKALMMGALQTDNHQLGFESVKAVMLAAAAAAAAAAVQSQHRQGHDQDGDRLSEDNKLPDTDRLYLDARQSFSRGKRRKQVNPKSTRAASAQQQAVAEQEAGCSPDSQQVESEQEDERSMSSMSCDIKPTQRDLNSVYGLSIRASDHDDDQFDDDGDDDDDEEEDDDRSELFKSKFTDRVLGRSSLSAVASSAGGERHQVQHQHQPVASDGEASQSDNDDDEQQQNVDMLGERKSVVVKHEPEDFNNNQGENKNCLQKNDGGARDGSKHELSDLMMHSDIEGEDEAEGEEDDSNEHDDEASGSSSNVNMNLSDNSSNNSANVVHNNNHPLDQQQQQLLQQSGLPNPLTSINGEVIEDISQSYVKTANPNAARKGGKRNRHCYKCKLCTYSSVDRCTLVRHLRIHSGERPYICGICRYAFTTKANCERHVRKRHKKQYNSLGGAGGGGVKGSNGGGRSLIITDHSNHQTIPVKVNPVAAQTISQTLQRIQEKQQNSLQADGDDDITDNIERLQSNQRQNQHQLHSHHPTKHQQQEQQLEQLAQQPTDHVNTRLNNETTMTSLTTSGYKQGKRKHRNDEVIDNNNHHHHHHHHHNSAPSYQRRRLLDKQHNNTDDDLFGSTNLSNESNLLCNQQPNNSFPGLTAPTETTTSTNELFANLMAQLQQVTSQHQQDLNINGNGGGSVATDTLRLTRDVTSTNASATFLANLLASGKTLDAADGQQLLNSAQQQRSLLLPKQLSQQFNQLRNLNSQTPFFIRRNPFDLFNPIDLAAQALDLSCKFQSK